MAQVARRVLAAGATLAAVLLVGWIAWLWNDSRLPSTYSVMSYGSTDFGGGSVPAVAHQHHLAAGSVSVAALQGPDGVPDDRFTLTARRAHVRLSSGRTVDALTFNGRVPGPELRVHQGDVVEVTLRNKDVDGGVTVHWHGVDVPNAEDGVAGVTQDAVRPGETFTYRFRAGQRGTFWYHTHQTSSKEVRRGLYGAFVIEPRHALPGLDLTLVSHTFGSTPVLNGHDRLVARAVAPGTPVRLRLVNSDSTPRRFSLGGAPFRVVALDGTELHEPSSLIRETVEIAAGGRADLAFRMPADRPVLLAEDNTDVGVVFSNDGKAAAPPPTIPEALFDPLTYGTRTPTSFASSAFDRRFRLTISRKPGFLDGHPGLQWAINGGIFPDVPVLVVRRGDLVEVTIANRTGSVHPMHLHGHHVLVLSRDGVQASGSPWWPDTLNVKGHETYVVGFRADNPGLWMEHCHNLKHAAEGLTMHVAYLGVRTPFEIGDGARNRPE